MEPTVLKARSAVVTAIDLSGGGPQLLRAEASEDDSGRRQPAVLFPAGTHALIEAEEGSQVPLDSGSVRVTEFTVGERGPEAMPADLPASSGYTYALELSVDEAESMGARGVSFDQALPIYLENFLGFRAGTAVPVGYYDRQDAAWKADQDGLVVAVLDEQNGAAQLDIDGSGTAATQGKHIAACAGRAGGAHRHTRLEARRPPIPTALRLPLPMTPRATCTGLEPPHRGSLQATIDLALKSSVGQHSRAGS